MAEDNNKLVMISGKSATGKSLSFRNIKDPEGVIYLNCENNKALPFPSKFKQAKITNPYDIYQAFDEAENMAGVHTIIIDSATFLMDMYETMHVLNAKNTLQAWGEYAQFFKRLMSVYVTKSTKNILFTAHTLSVLNEAEMIMETLIKVKGSLMNNGIESFFSNVISCKKVSIEKLEAYNTPLLTITDEEKMLGFKYVYQTKLTKETVDERIRSPLAMWDINETFIDNDAQLVIDRLNLYYN